MSHIQRQVVSAQRRLWLNRWLHQLGWMLVAAVSGWTITWIVNRVFSFQLPMAWIALGAAGAAVVGSIVWLLLTRDSAQRAATALDEAAGLKERVSTGLMVNDTTDPFAQAVKADAERAIAGLSARKFIPVRWAKSLSFSAAMLVIAALSLLIPEMDVLRRKESQAQAAAQRQAIKQVQQAVAKPVEAMKKILEANPDLVQPELKDLEAALKKDEPRDASALRREAVKTIDKLSEALKDKLNSDRFNALKETKKRLGKLGEPADAKSEVGKLQEALSKGEFEEAQDQVKKMQEELSKRTKEGKADPQKTAELQKQLDQLAESIQKMAQDKQSVQELKNMGLSEQEAKKMLQELAKKSPEELKQIAKDLAQRLKDKGVTEQQMKDLMEKMQQKQKASEQCQKMGQCMKQAAQKMKEGDPESAKQELDKAGEQLSEMEQMEQSLNEMESQLSELQKQRDDMSEQQEEEQEGEGECKQCDGKGFGKDGKPCPGCKKPGQGMGGGGPGEGHRERGDPGDHQFKNEKAKTKSNPKGRIIGEQYVKGTQLKGKSSAELEEAAAAAEQDATDALNKDRVPMRYRNAVKKYFDRLPQDLRAGEGDTSSTAPKAGAPN